MRNLWLFLLIALAAAGLWYLAGADDGPEAGEELEVGAEGSAGTDDDGTKGLVAVQGRPTVDPFEGVPLPGGQIDMGVAQTTILRFNTDATRLTGADWLEAVRPHAGDKIPLRFASEKDLETFRTTELFDQAPPAQMDAAGAMGWLRERGFGIEPQGRFFLVRIQHAEEPYEEEPAVPPPSRGEGPGSPRRR